MYYKKIYSYNFRTPQYCYLEKSYATEVIFTVSITIDN